ncbi:tRNA pseudouridine synthase D TruD [Helicobacter sp. NHP21005]|uniref:tRNA pseudouridine(13) synthase TruD n=1 Tax=Helicobacter felistomachi TaxID=3040201 RepID=UPI002572C20A|nr:tRNA pseudouridine(13) synthase TruD [Helicobacter sp. NHP21005]BEG56401.1 tRNA pseudouridine synthase D TruD [Helicobacter sp. NHP21005]
MVYNARMQNENQLPRFFSANHAPIEFYFKKCARDFLVQEEPLYPFSQSGEHLIVHVRKKDKTTWEMLGLLSQVLGCKMSVFGYAGLKDKNALTFQYISMPKAYEKALSQHAQTLYEQGVKILDTTTHTHKIRLGHLKGNHFAMRLKKLTPLSAQKIAEVLGILQEKGFLNYFGAQRFGRRGDNFKQAHTGKKKLDKFLLSSQQSFCFNQWLSGRARLNAFVNNFSPLEIVREYPQISLEQAKALKAQPQDFKLLEGDVLCHYPFGKYFHHSTQDLDTNLKRLQAQSLVATGLLPGDKVLEAKDLAKAFEEPFKQEIHSSGDRRFALVYPKEVDFLYLSQEAQGQLKFFLPKGAYATIFLEEIARQELFNPDV